MAGGRKAQSERHETNSGIPHDVAVKGAFATWFVGKVELDGVVHVSIKPSFINYDMGHEKLGHLVLAGDRVLIPVVGDHNSAFTQQGVIEIDRKRRMHDARLSTHRPQYPEVLIGKTIARFDVIDPNVEVGPVVGGEDFSSVHGFLLVWLKVLSCLLNHIFQKRKAAFGDAAGGAGSD